ncbi:MAG: hypothetical protein SFV19_08885 [Rhodospirillaceae bacterium]|nr:hypothetical protein [Rhodospirillaceae bacterium]
MRSATGVLSLGTILAVLMATTVIAQDGDNNAAAAPAWTNNMGEGLSGRSDGNPGFGGDGWDRAPRDIGGDLHARKVRDGDGWDRGGRDRDGWDNRGRHDNHRHDRHRHDRGGNTRIIIGGGIWGDSWGRDPWRGDHWDHRPRHRYPDPWVRYWRPPFYYGGTPWWYGRPRTIIVWSIFPPYIYDRLHVRARGYHEQAYEQAMAAPVGQAVSWTDASTAGTITTTRDGYAGERYCREFQQNVTLGGENQQAWGVACQEPDGSWQLVKQQE